MHKVYWKDVSHQSHHYLVEHTGVHQDCAQYATSDHSVAFMCAMQPLEFVLSASVGSLLVVAVVVLRIYLGWSYVGERLLSAAVPYEETGW